MFKNLIALLEESDRKGWTEDQLAWRLESYAINNRFW